MKNSQATKEGLDVVGAVDERAEEDDILDDVERRLEGRTLVAVSPAWGVSFTAIGVCVGARARARLKDPRVVQLHTAIRTESDATLARVQKLTGWRRGAA
jgi:hypothetical protein